MDRLVRVKSEDILLNLRYCLLCAELPPPLPPLSLVFSYFVLGSFYTQRSPTPDVARDRAKGKAVETWRRQGTSSERAVFRF